MSSCTAWRSGLVQPGDLDAQSPDRVRHAQPVVGDLLADRANQQVALFDAMLIVQPIIRCSRRIDQRYCQQAVPTIRHAALALDSALLSLRLGAKP